MEDFSKTLEQLQNKAKNCSKSERLLALDFLKNLINNLEQIDKTTNEENLNNIKEEKLNSKINDDNKNGKKSLAPLKLTIRKFKKNDTVFTCQECDKKFITMSKMVTHVLSSHSKSEVTCKICKGTFYSCTLMNVHECIHLKQTVFIRRMCGICRKMCLQIEDFQSHMKNEHMIELEKRFKSFNCNQCDSTFKLKSQLLVHMSKRHKESSKDVMAQRIRFNLLKKTISLQKRKSIDDKNNNVSWISSKHSCSICKRNFLSHRALERHSLSYMHKMRSGELKLIKKFICDICNSSFIKLNCLQRHMTSHQADLPHKCNICDYRTSEKCNLTEHMRRHYQIRNYICEFCDAKFIAKRELKDHVAFKHNTIRPYECSDCGKMFKTKRILTRHCKIHSNFRPYVCACGSNFLRMTNLRRHIVGIHHDSNPTITKIQVAVDKSDIDNENTKFVWYADSKYISIKKITALTLAENDLPKKNSKKKLVDAKKVKNESKTPEKIHESSSKPKRKTTTNQMLSINYMIKVPDEDDDKDPKLYTNISQDDLYQSDSSDKYLQSSQSPTLIPVINGIISIKSSLQDASTIDESMNICDLVTSPSYPLLETTDPSDEPPISNKISYDISMKNENISKYKVESIMMESENRNNLDGIWRPIDTGDQDANIIDEHTSSLVSNSIDMFPQNSGLISSFNEVFLSSVSNNCYSEDAVHWNNLSLGNNGNFTSGDNSNFIITGPMSACEPINDQMPVSDSNHTSADNFLFYNNQSQQHNPEHNNHQSFAYIESYSSSVHLDHNYGSINDNIANISFCTGTAVNNSSSSFQQQTIINTSQQHMQDLFPISYSSTSHSDFITNNSNTSLSNMLFNSEQPFFSTNSTIPNNNMINSNQSNWLHGPYSPISDYSSDNLSSSILDSYKLPSQMNMASSGPINSVSNHPPRILSPIDFLVSDSVYPPGIGINENPLISDYCTSQAHHQYHQTTSGGQLCSKNFSVVNLISTGCASHNSSKDTDDIELLYS